MTPQELEQERQYRITERLGILCGTGPETLSATFIAGQEAEACINQLKEQND